MDIHAPSGERRRLVPGAAAAYEQAATLAAVAPATPVARSAEKLYRERRIALRGLLDRLGLDDQLPFADLTAWRQQAAGPLTRRPRGHLLRWTQPTREQLSLLLAARAALIACLDDALRQAAGK